jgi:hypothetical protein
MRPVATTLLVICMLAATLRSELQAQAETGTLNNPVQMENTQLGDSLWQRQRAPGFRIQGYAAEVSVAPGEFLHLHVSTNPTFSYRVEFFRLGWYGGLGGRLVGCTPACDGSLLGSPQALPTPDLATGIVVARWPTTSVVQVPPTWTSGYYLAELVVLSGTYEGRAYVFPFVVRQASTQPPSAILVVAPVTTWAAYNDWEGNDLYTGTTGPPGVESLVRPSRDRLACQQV